MICTTYETPLGQMRMIAEQGVLVRLDFDRAPMGQLSYDDPLFLQLQKELKAYFAGKLKSFSIPYLLPNASTFTTDVWQRLATVEYGKTISYGELARSIGKKGSARAVGSAVGKNPLTILQPCHRVLGSSGKLTGYAWGLDKKRKLLRLEGAL